MKRRFQIFACITLAISVWACERPQAPDFKVDHTLQVPLTVAKTYQFLGNSNALIDTTGENFDSLFTVGSNGLISIAKEESFDFGDLNDAIPQVNVDPVTVISEVGEISLTNFSSNGSLGSAGFKEITGESTSLQKGDNLPGGSTPGPIKIDLDTDYFVSATIKNDGSLAFTVTNNLGFDISNLTITLNSGSSFVGSTSLNSFQSGETSTCSIPIPANSFLSNLNVDITAGWNGQPMQEDANKLVVNAVTGKNLTASQITAAIESQEFNSIGTSTVDDSNFKFTKPDHFIALSSGLLSIDIINQIDLGIENLEISFPDIRNSSTDAPLVMNMNHIPSASAGGQFSASQDLSGYRIYATGNEIDYNIHAVTENTQQGTGSEKVTIRQDDKLQAMVEINNLEIAKAKGVIIPRTVLLNDDEAADEKLDVFNDREAEVINIDGISDLSEQISDITFANPVLSMIYETNLTAHATIYAAIAGVNADGKTVYLSGKPGGKYYVSQAEIPSELRAKGRALDENQLIQFRIEPSGDGSTISRSVEFDSTGTNASGFFSNLPSEIHFVGIARINEDGGAETISTPITFDSRLSVDLPLYFSAQNATFTDTLEADLSDLPGKSDDQQLTQATFTINYTNGLPFGLDLSLIFMNENGDEITSYPLNGQNPVSVQAASVNPTTGFVEEDGGQAGKFQLSLTEDQLKIINQTRSIMLKINFDTSRGKEVKVRAEDSITLRLKMSVDMTSTVN